ncbi:361_t:CDS:2, partial [Acaulospora colombiana]
PYMDLFMRKNGHFCWIGYHYRPRPLILYRGLSVVPEHRDNPRKWTSFPFSVYRLNQRPSFSCHPYSQTLITSIKNLLSHTSFVVTCPNADRQVKETTLALHRFDRPYCALTTSCQPIPKLPRAHYSWNIRMSTSKESKMSKQAFLFFPQVAPVGWHLMEEYHDDSNQLDLHSIGQEFVDLAEDVHMFLKYLQHHPTVDGKVEWNPLGPATSSNLADSCFLVASTSRDCFTFLLSLPEVKERSSIQTRLHAIHKKLLESARNSKYSANLPGPISLYEASQAYSRLRYARLQLSRSLKHSIQQDPSKFIDSRNTGRKGTKTPSLIDRLHRLHRKYPLRIGGPLLNESNLPAWALNLDKLNDSVGIHWLKAASSQEGQRWVHERPQDDKHHKQAELMEIFWSTVLEQIRQIPGRNEHPGSRQFELMLRSRMCQSEASVVTVAVLGLVNSG